MSRNCFLNLVLHKWTDLLNILQRRCIRNVWQINHTCYSFIFYLSMPFLVIVIFSDCFLWFRFFWHYFPFLFAVVVISEQKTVLLLKASKSVLINIRCRFNFIQGSNEWEKHWLSQLWWIMNHSQISFNIWKKRLKFLF